MGTVFGVPFWFSSFVSVWSCLFCLFLVGEFAFFVWGGGRGGGGVFFVFVGVFYVFFFWGGGLFLSVCFEHIVCLVSLVFWGLMLVQCLFLISVFGYCLLLLVCLLLV